MENNDYIRNRDILTVEMVKCPQNTPLSEPQPLNKCDNCLFFGGRENNAVKCLYDAPLLSSWAHVHALKFQDERFIYESHNVGELSKEEQDEYVKNGYDCCKWCCFNRKLSNGEEYCFLRNALNDEIRDPFICYEGEFFIATPMEEEN